MKGNLFKGLFMLIVLGILIAVISFFTLQIKTYTGDIDSFFIVINGQKITTSASGFNVSSDNSLQVDVVSPLELESQEYTIEIIPNKIKGKDFDIVLDNYYKLNFFDESELSDGFIIDKYDDYFTIKSIGSLTDILQNYYVNDVSNCDNYIYDDMFTLIVSSKDKNIKVNFTIKGA